MHWFSMTFDAIQLMLSDMSQSATPMEIMGGRALWGRVEAQALLASSGLHAFQDVKEKVLPAEPIRMLRSRMPDRLRKLIC